MTTIAPISMRDTARAVTLTIKVTHAKRTRFRLLAFSGLLRLACYVSPCNVAVECVED